MPDDNDEKNRQNLPWLLRRDTVQSSPGTPQLDRTGAMYKLYENTRNPYLKRAIAPEAPKTDRSSEELSKLFQFFSADQSYRVGPANETPAHRKRTLDHPKPEKPPHPVFQESTKLPGDLFKLPWMIDEFFRDVLTQLRTDPAQFDVVVTELMTLFADHGIQIRLYDAYYALEDWDDLTNTLEEIARYPAVETFDLFCSALIAYHDLVYPSD